MFLHRVGMSQIKRGTNIIILKVVSLCFMDVTLHETQSYYNIPQLHRERRPEAPLSCCHLSLLSHLSYFSCHPFLLCRISRSRVQFLPPMILVIKVEFQHKVGRYACLLSKLQAQRFLV